MLDHITYVAQHFYNIYDILLLKIRNLTRNLFCVGGLQEGEDIAARWEQMCGMSIGALAELVFLPLGMGTCVDGKRKVSIPYSSNSVQ